MLKKFLSLKIFKDLNSEPAKKGLKAIILMKLVGFVGQLVVAGIIVCIVMNYANNSREYHKNKFEAHAASMGISAENPSENQSQITEKEYDKLYKLTNEMENIPSAHREILDAHGMVYVSNSTISNGQLVYGASDGQWYWLLYEENNFAPVGEPACSLDEFMKMLAD